MKKKWGQLPLQNVHFGGHSLPSMSNIFPRTPCWLAKELVQ